MRTKTALKSLLFSSLALAVIMSFAPRIYAANNIGLKSNSIINDNTIKLGDIFYGLKRNEDRVLGIAPRPGKDMVLNARTLLRIAVALDLPWRPTNAQDKITLRRDGSIIKAEDIKNALRQEISKNAVNKDYEITIHSYYDDIILPSDLPASVEVTDLDIDKTRTKFSANISAPSAQNPVHTLRITGILEPTISIPVLNKNIQKGKIITSRDIEYITIKERGFSSTTIIDNSTLIGMAARRGLISGRAIHLTDVAAPQIIKRGALVVLSLNQGSLNLTTQAKALENGAKGDVIRIVNTASNQTLQAMVIGSNEVQIMSN